jgi:hypothetical protein
MRWLLVPLVLVLSACQAVAAPSSFHAPALKPGEVLVTGNDAANWRWREPPNYSFMVDSRVALITLGGEPKRVVVRDHHRIEPEGDSPVTRARYPTFAEIQSHAESALAGGAFVAVVLAADGRPTFVYIDDPRFSDDEFSASMTDYRPS